MKTCTKCGGVKPLSAFAREKRARDGAHTQCKTCVAARVRRYQREHPERNRARVRAWRVANPEKTRDYALRHVEKLRGLARAKYKKHREVLLARKREGTKALSLAYVRALLRQRGIDNPPAELLAAKRAHLKVTRLIKEKTK